MKNSCHKNTLEKRAIHAAKFSIYSNTSLVILKFIVGFQTGSVSVISEAAHSGSDLLASWIAYFSVSVSRKPADSEHPYGHGKLESLSGMAEALLIFAAAIWIIYEAINKLRHPVIIDKPGFGLTVMLVSAIVNILVSRYLYRTARQTDSLALEADAAHLATDVWTSFGVVIGLALVWITGIQIFDPIVAIMVALIITQAAYRLTKGAISLLMDVRLPDEDEALVSKILEDDQRVLGYHRLRSRKSGHARYIDVHVQFEDSMPFIEAHDLTEELEDKIRASLPEVEITMHSEPYWREMKHQVEHHKLDKDSSKK
jgi:cation diffusion facilitator family transporter